MTNKPGNLLATASVLLLLSGQAGAEDNTRYDRVGSVDAVDVVDHTVTINDSVYRLSPRVLVYSQQRRLMDLGGLRSGQTVGLEISGDGRDNQGVRAIWVIPGGQRNAE